MEPIFGPEMPPPAAPPGHGGPPPVLPEPVPPIQPPPILQQDPADPPVAAPDNREGPALTSACGHNQSFDSNKWEVLHMNRSFDYHGCEWAPHPLAVVHVVPPQQEVPPQAPQVQPKVPQGRPKAKAKANGPRANRFGPPIAAGPNPPGERNLVDEVRRVQLQLLREEARTEDEEVSFDTMVSLLRLAVDARLEENVECRDLLWLLISSHLVIDITERELRAATTDDRPDTELIWIRHAQLRNWTTKTKFGKSTLRQTADGFYTVTPTMPARAGRDEPGYRREDAPR